MEIKQIENKVKDILADVLSVNKEKINNASHLVEDLGADSFNAVEILYALQKEFKIEISKTMLAKVSKVQDMIDYLEKQIGKK